MNRIVFKYLSVIMLSFLVSIFFVMCGDDEGEGSNTGTGNSEESAEETGEESGNGEIPIPTGATTLNDEEMIELCTYILEVFCEKSVECEMFPKEYLEECVNTSAAQCEKQYKDDGVDEYPVEEEYVDQLTKCLSDLSEMDCEEFKKGNVPDSCKGIE